ncbi:MAG: lysine--tRNA ligase, partial [Dongiaceae bacterium]
MTKPKKAEAPALDDNEYRRIRLEKAQKLRELGVNPYPYHFERSHQAADLQQKYKDLPADQETEDHVKIAGRVMAHRNSGMFMDIMDVSGKIQVFSHKDNLSILSQSILALLDIGDIVGVEGTIRRTARGELSVKATVITVLSKALLPLPEKYHGLSDTEIRYRQRYVDLIMNEKTRDTLRKRSAIVAAMRRYYDSKGFLEVETPMLHAIMGGASAKPFITHHNALDTDFYLRVAPELHLKRLIVGGLADGVYEINRCFRNEGLSIKHNPEFTSVESYQAFADYNEVMSFTENLVAYVAEEVLGTKKITFQGKEIDLTPPWPRRSMVELVKEKTNIDFLQYPDAKKALEVAGTIGIKVDPKSNWGQVVAAVFDEKVESSLIQPTHVT